MSTTTAKGYKKPSTGDRNWYADLEFNIDRVDAHSHNGTDSVQLTSMSIAKSTQDVLAANWTSLGEGNYKQTLTLPLTYTWNDSQIRFYVNGGALDGQEVLLSVKRVSPTTFDVFINDNTLSLKVVYG
jgi:hypothetical protein